MDVAAWLQGLGLERYVPAFRDNEVNERILPSLTAEDLKDLGVTLVGHRRLLLDAIAALSAGPPVAAPHAAALTLAPSDAPSLGGAERRQLTVMFCDLVGSTALSTRHDPEDLRDLIGDYHRAVAETVGRFDGFVAKYMGDGVLIYFGYLQAHEDDAERAVRAGLAVIEAVGKLPAREGAQALAQQGSYDEALVKLAEGFERIEATGERFWQAELHRGRGLVLLAQNDLDEAQTSFQQAIRIAQAQQAKSLELRAARDLARLWGERGRRAEARNLLVPVYGWFTEGFDTADLKEAKALLDELT